jgi:hypothetical protein
MDAFKSAADRWCKVLVGDLPSYELDGEVIDDVLIEAQGVVINVPGGILGQARPTHCRPSSAGSAALLPAKGIMSFDTFDLAQMEQDGRLHDVITHEMGHVLGIGTRWSAKGLLKGKGTADPTFVGQNASREYGMLLGSGAMPVPVENDGKPGTRDSHWRKVIFGNELMTGSIGAPGMPISRITIASLADLGYQVDMNAAEPYSLPVAMVALTAGSIVEELIELHDLTHTDPSSS